MIYIKRFCLCIVAVMLLLLAGITFLLQLVTFPLYGLVYYVTTGEDPLNEEYMDFFINHINNFMDWYKNKFGPNDDQRRI